MLQRGARFLYVMNMGAAVIHWFPITRLGGEVNPMRFESFKARSEDSDPFPASLLADVGRYLEPIP